MVTVRKKYSGADLIQDDLNSYHWIATEEDDAYYNPHTTTDIAEAMFQNTHIPREGDGVHWNYVKINFTTSTSEFPTDFMLRQQLLGVTLMGDEVILGDRYEDSIGAEATREYIYTLTGSIGIPPVTLYSGTCTSGKFQLTLPKRFEHYQDDSFILYYNSGADSITQDTQSDDTKRYVTFTVPGGWTPASDVYFSVTEADGFTYTTDTVPMSNQDIYFLGYNNPNAFDGLRVKNTITATGDYTVTINYIEYCYEVNK
jgi:hypothetical protein